MCHICVYSQATLLVLKHMMGHSETKIQFLGENIVKTVEITTSKKICTLTIHLSVLYNQTEEIHNK